MKHLFFTALGLLALPALHAQSPVYVLFNSNCMQQMEYKYTRSGASVFAYSVQPNSDEQYVFMSGTGSMPTPTLPEGTLDCRNLTLTDEVVRIINEQTSYRQMYVLVQQPTSGYLMMPIYSATQIKRYGSWYLLVGPKFTFAVDTTRLSYQDNLQGEASPTVIRFTGSEMSNCRYQWHFHGEPARGYSERVDFDFVYGIGITNSRIGSTAADLENSEIRLVNVNGVRYENYLASMCPQTQQVNNNTTSNWTATPTYGNAKTGEPDKETSSQINNNNWNNNNYGGALANCPTPPGAGYHVVQPKESLKAIARTYNVDLKSLIRWNDIKNPDHIEICQKVWVQKPPAAPSTVSKGNAPAQYSTDNQVVANQSIYWNNNQQSVAPRTSSAPTQYSTPSATQMKGTTTHIVQKGDYLYSLARRYSCPEECIRRANNFPAQGDVVLQVGQVVIIECACMSQGFNTTPKNVPAPSSMPPQVKEKLNVQTQAQPLQYNPVEYTNPVTYGTNTNPTPGYYPSTANPAGNTNPASTNPTAGQQDLPPTQEYIVRQGETMNSIAVKFKMNLAELAALNSLGQDEKLIPGKRLVVRRYQ